MTLREAKQQFFALRNGLLADMLRKQGVAQHKMIFGLNVVQLRQIADETGRNAELAAELWADKNCRESRLLAPMVHPIEQSAFAMMHEVQTVEEADILCHRLLRLCSEALNAAKEALGSDVPLTRYCALRLLLNLLPDSADAAREAIKSVPSNPVTDAVVRQLQLELADEEDSLL